MKLGTKRFWKIILVENGNKSSINSLPTLYLVTNKKDGPARFIPAVGIIQLIQCICYIMHNDAHRQREYPSAFPDQRLCFFEN